MAVVTDYTALLGRLYWNLPTPTTVFTLDTTPGSPGLPAVVTYSFATDPAVYLGNPKSSDFAASFKALGPYYQTLARDALGEWAAVSGLTFVEVGSGEGDIAFGSYDLDEWGRSSALAFAFYPGRFLTDQIAFEFEFGGDIFLSRSLFAYTGPDRTFTDYYVLLHEIGHALGFQHSHDGDLILADELDTGMNTVMSYHPMGANGLGPLDIAAAQYAYGPPDPVFDDPSELRSFDLNAMDLSLRQVWGDAGSSIYGSSLNDIVFAGGGDDLMGGFDGKDALYAETGDDTVFGGDGDDTLFGGEGGDSIRGNNGDDYLGGGSGDDTMGGGRGADTIFGGTGNDSVDGFDGDDEIGGFIGNDTLSGGRGNDRLWGAAGDDSLVGNSGDDTLGGSLGDDDLTGSGGRDVLWGGAGRDTLRGGDGDDVLGAGRGNDLLVGDSGNDQIFGGVGADEIEGGSGNDSISGGADDDRISSGEGADIIHAERGDDVVFAGEGNDLVLGNSGNDTIYGGAGNDRIEGGAGDDSVIGSGGDDTLTGGAGADVFVFSADLAGNARITDFAPDDADHLFLYDSSGRDWSDPDATLSTIAVEQEGQILLSFGTGTTLGVGGGVSLSDLADHLTVL